MSHHPCPQSTACSDTPTKREQTVSDLRTIAEERVFARFRFYVHAGVFGVVITSLWLINAASADRLWAPWPTLGWGIGLICHGLKVAISQRMAASALHDGLVQAEIDALREHHGG